MRPPQRKYLRDDAHPLNRFVALKFPQCRCGFPGGAKSEVSFLLPLIFTGLQFTWRAIRLVAMTAMKTTGVLYGGGGKFKNTTGRGFRSL